MSSDSHLLIPESVLLGVMWPGHEADYTPTSRTELQKAGSFTFTPPFIIKKFLGEVSLLISILFPGVLTLGFWCVMYWQGKKSKRKHDGTHAIEPAVTSNRLKHSVADELDGERGECKPQGWSSSLFVNNPDIPAFAHRVVNPVSEPVFSSQKFKDLPIHPFMVSDALCRFMQVQCCREGWAGGCSSVCASSATASVSDDLWRQNRLSHGTLCSTQPNRHRV
jgi:hypothetical protein